MYVYNYENNVLRKTKHTFNSHEMFSCSGNTKHNVGWFLLKLV